MNFENNKSHEFQQGEELIRNVSELSNRIMAGLDRFLSLVFEGHPVTLAAFLDSSEKYFDSYIVEASQKEHLSFVGGKLIFTPKPVSPGHSASSLSNFQRAANGHTALSCRVEITANLYFQDAQKNWVMKTVQGHTSSDSISDWDTAPELEELRKGKPIEFPIDPPEVAG